MAVVVCKGVFHDAPDPKLQDKVGHFMTIARVPDCVELLPFDQLREAFNSYNEAATAIDSSSCTIPTWCFQMCISNSTASTSL